VPSRTRCHHVNIWCACASQASPLSAEHPPRSRLASKSLSQCAQQRGRHRTGYQLYALERSVPRRPEQRSPNSSRAPWPPRDSRTTHTVTRLVTATPHHARLAP
jgi:hypothetical protein